MSKRESIARYSLIIKKLRKQPASFKEISNYLKSESELQDYHFDVSKRTFLRDLNDIRSLYDLDIRYNRSKKVYCVDTEGQNEAFERIMEAFDVFSALDISDRLSDYIHFENRRAMGTENLYGLLHSIKNRVQIKFLYQKFWEDEPSTKVIEPYALKEFKNRWYLVGNDIQKKAIRIYALDRLNELEISKVKFEYPGNFDIHHYFRDCFGIISSGGQQPEEVILSFTPDQGKYIKSLPLHHSQQILIDNSVELRLKLKLVATFDFVMEILSHGTDVKVIQPKSLVDEIRNKLQAALNQYS